MEDIRGSKWFREFTDNVVTSLNKMIKNKEIELIEINITYSRRGVDKIKINYDTQEGQKGVLKSFSIDDI